MRTRASVALLAAALSLAVGAQALALTSASAPIRARIIERVGIDVVSPLVLPSVTATSVSAVSGVNGVAGVSGSRGSTSLGGNATLTIRSQLGGAVSMSVPESFTVVRTGGTESLTVKTSTNSEFGLGGDGVMLGGSAIDSNTMSVNVGGAIQLASTDNLVPGPYEGLLVVVVQYN